MSVKIAAAVIGENGPRGMGPRMTLFLIAHQADDLGFYAEDVESIRAGLDCSKETVLRHLAALEEDGWLRIERRILAGRSSVYFVNLAKLGVAVPDKPYKHKLWSEIDRLRQALDRGDKLSLQNRTLQFESLPDSRGNVVSGDLFAGMSGDNLPPHSMRHEPPKVAQSRNFPENTPKVSDSGPISNDGRSESEISGDNLPPDRLQNATCQVAESHLTGGKFPSPFNSCRKDVVEDFVSTPPFPPQAGEEESSSEELVLPFADPRPGEAGWAESAGVAARWVMRRIGTAKRRMETLLVDALAIRVREQRDETLADAARLAVANFEKQQADFDRGLINREHPLKPENFFEFRRWERMGTWGYRRPDVRSDASVGANDQAVPSEAEREAESAREIERRRAWIEACAAKVEAAGCVSSVADELRDLRFDTALLTGGLEQLDARLNAIEERMTALAQEQMPTERLEELRAQVSARYLPDLRRWAKPEVIAQQLAGALEREVLKELGLPRLSLFYMSQPGGGR